MDLTVLFTLAIFVAATHQQKCYWQSSSTPDDNLSICEGTAGSCCGKNDACFQDGLCMSASGYFYQGGCTIEGWNQGADGCFSQCDASNPDVTFAPVSPCPFSNETVKLCCGWAYDAGDCCESESDGFTFEFPLFQGRLNSPVFKDIVSSAEAAAAGSTVTTTVGNLEAATNAAFFSSHGYVKKSVPIGIGVALGIAFLVSLATIAWLSIKLRRRLPPTEVQPHYGQDYREEYEREYKPPIEADDEMRPHELRDHPRYEVQGDDVAELFPNGR